MLLRTVAFTCLVLTLTSPNNASSEVGSPDAADSLSVRVIELRCEGRYADALVLARALADVRREDPSSRRWQRDDAARLTTTLIFATNLSRGEREKLAEADRLSATIDQHMEQGRYRLAADEAGHQIAIRKKLLGAEHPDVVESLYLLSAARWRLTQHAEGERLAREGLRVCQVLYENDHPQVAECLNMLGLVLMAQGKYDEAEKAYYQALDLFRKLVGDENEQVSMCLNNLGAFYGEIDDAVASESYYREALAMNRRILGNEHPRIARGMHNLAFHLNGQGDLLAAELLLREALAMRKKLLGPDHPDVGITTHILAQVMGAVGNTAEADSLFREALAIRRKTLGDRHSHVAWSLMDLAHLSVVKGDHLEAEAFAREALSIWQEATNESPNVVRGLTMLGGVYSRQGNHDAAVRTYVRALETYRTIHGNDNYQIINLLAATWYALGDYAKAESLLTIAAREFESARLRAATVRARTRWRANSPYPYLAATRLSMGKTIEAWRAAERSLSRGLTDQLTMSVDYMSPEDAARYDDLKAHVAERERTLHGLRRASREGTTERMGSEIERVRNELLEAEARFSRLQTDMTRKYRSSQGHVYSLDRIQRALSTDVALVGWLDHRMLDRPVSWGYVIRNTGHVRWVEMKPQAIDRAGEFRESLQFAAAWPARVGTNRQTTDEASDLYADRIEPLQPYLEDINAMVVIPSGPMLGVPIEALIDADGEYIGDRYSVSYSSSATIYTLLRERGGVAASSSSESMLLVGDPPFSADRVVDVEGDRFTVAYGGAHSIHDVTVLRSALAGNPDALASLPPLPHSRREVNQIALLVPHSTLLLGTDAAEDNVVAMVASGEMKRFRNIHFATHALVDDRYPERSAIILAQTGLPEPLETIRSGRRLTDGFITADEISREWELNADLVTLSACQTALGRRQAGEGYIGFAHAFFLAGAQSLIVSLWDVDDTATSLLMQRFYENLTGGYENQRDGATAKPMSKSRALREAKKWLREFVDVDGGRPFAHPAYWSAFILVGDPS